LVGPPRQFSGDRIVSISDSSTLSGEVVVKAALALVCALAFLVGCDNPIQSPDGSITIDSGPRPVDSGPSCTDAAACDDGVYCNGAETCAAGACVSGTPPCSAAMCDEETDTCACTPADADGDGADSIACGGDDCDDEDARRAVGNAEVCDLANIDEDCNPATYGFRDSDMDGAPDAMCCNEDGAGGMRCGDDCDDMRPGVSPSDGESCNGIDDDCDGTIDEDVLNTYYIDGDDDDYGVDDAATNVTACFTPSGYADRAGDCDDGAGAIHPGLPDLCDAMGVDDDCNGTPNDPPGGCMCTGTDSRPCVASGVCSAGTESCNGGAWGACSITAVPEVCDGRDEDCDGVVDDGTQTTCFADGDGDGYAASGAPATPLCPASGGFGGCPSGYTTRLPVATTIDCDDTVYATSPAGVESCNGVDDDCDGMADELLRVTCYLDVDNDTYSAAGATSSSQCADSTRTLTGLCPIGYTNRAPSPADCDDLVPGRSPAAVEVCDGVDQDCDGTIDETVAVSCYPDVDNDTYAGTGATTTQQCRDVSRPALEFCPIGYTNRAPTASSFDCDVTNASINPAATETCGLPPVDEDCDGMANPSSDCSCGDGTVRACPLPGHCATGTEQCSGGMWGACSVAPVAETCDGEDEDCDGSTDEGLVVTCYADGDNDSYALAGASASLLCPVAGRPGVGGCPLNYTNRVPGAGASDCNDTRADVSPAGTEVCSDTMPAADETCSGMIDEGLRVTCYADGDGDNYAPSTSTATSRCRDSSRPTVGFCPPGFTNRAPASGTDCDDGAAAVSPGATEICDRVDSNCSTGGGVATDEDADGDGHAAIGAPCSGGFPKDDCRDDQVTTYLGATETCDRVDSNCSTGGGVALDEDFDGDMYAPDGAPCTGGYPKTDCADRVASAHPNQYAYFATPYCTGGGSPINCGGGFWTCDVCDSCGGCAPPTPASWDYNCAGGGTFQPLQTCTATAGELCLGNVCISGPSSIPPGAYCGQSLGQYFCSCGGGGPIIGSCGSASFVSAPLRCH
jgi:hypothetical protein